MSFVKRIIFHLLLALRGIILAASKLLAFVFITCFILTLVVSDFHSTPMPAKIMSIVFGIFFILINWFYDYVIFYFQPENIEIELYR